jgi:XTP/dITP diphosphohydrolase
MVKERVLTVATGNAGKAKEFGDLLGNDWIIRTLLDYPDIPEVIEDGDSFEANACKKALEISRLVAGPVLADDSGLEVDFLNGSPGIYSARYAGESKSDEANNDKLLHELDAVPDELRGAQFHCALAIAENGRILATFDGIVRGMIIRKRKGSNGFGYDSLFQPETFSITTAEMDPEQKHQISHRGQAGRQAAEYLQQHFA